MHQDKKLKALPIGSTSHSRDFFVWTALADTGKLLAILSPHRHRNKTALSPLGRPPYPYR